MRLIRTFALIVCATMLADAKVTLTQVASGTTIAVNLLEIKSTVAKAKVAAKRTKKVVKKVAKVVSDKVRGK